MIENLNGDILIPVSITLLGFMSYFFGKIITEEYTGIEEKSQNYIVGFIFVLIYLVLPLVTLYSFKSYLLFKLNLFWEIAFFVLLCGIMKYFDVKKNVHFVRKGQAYAEFEEEALKKTKEILSGFNLSSDDNYLLRVFKWAFASLPSQTTVLVLTFAEIVIVSNLIYSVNITLGVIFFILFVTSMSNVAQLSVAKVITYPEVVLKDNAGKTYKGRIIKYGDEFVSIRNKRKVYNFSRENITYVMTLEKLPFAEQISKKEASQQ